MPDEGALDWRRVWLRTAMAAAASLAMCTIFGACSAIPGGTAILTTPRTIVDVGRFGADSTDCPWVQDDAGHRTYLLLPDNVTLRANPFRIEDSGGFVIARSGDRIEVDGSAPSGGASICGPGIVPLGVEALRLVSGVEPLAS